MSSDVKGLVDRTFREYLDAPDTVNSYSYLTGGVAADASTVAYDGNLFSVEEEDALDAGAIIEIGQEIMFSTALNTVTNEITVKRGQRGTTAVAHTAGDIIKVAPSFTRKAVYDAVCDQIENLYPTIYAVEEQTIASATGYVALTGGDDNLIVAPLKAVSQYQTLSSGSETSVQFRGVSMELIDVPTSVTASGKVVQFFGISTGVNVHVSFKKKFGAVTNEDTTLTSIGLESEYEPIIMAGVAAQVLAGKDIASMDTSFITEQLNVANVPIGSANTIRNSLLQYQQLLIQQARKDLRARFPEPVSINSVVYPSA
jgi:hypothetical protein